MKIRSILLAGLTIILVLCLCAAPAFAYFTASVDAGGGLEVSVGTEPDIEERFANWTKEVTITADEDSEPVFVRARAFGTTYPFQVIPDEAGKWTENADGWWYYADPIAYGGETAVLKVQIQHVPEKDVKEGTNFNVVVVYEGTPVQYNPDGTAYADWNFTLNDGT